MDLSELGWCKRENFVWIKINEFLGTVSLDRNTSSLPFQGFPSLKSKEELYP
jgi:hypothetical protein